MSNKPTRFLDEIAWYCRTLSLLVWFNLPFTWSESLTLQLASTPKQTILHALQLVCYKELQLFHQLFALHRPTYLTERFRTFIRQQKELLSTALLFSLCALWPTRAFWHFSFLNSDFLRAILPHWPASPSLLLPGTGVIIPDRVLSLGKI